MSGDAPPPSPETERGPDGPPRPSAEPTGAAERASVRRAGRAGREDLTESVTDERMRAANDVVPLPLDLVTQDAFVPDVTLNDLQGALRAKQWGRVLQCAVKLLMSRRNEPRDLGFETAALTAALGRVTPSQLGGVLRQADRMGPEQQRGLSWETKTRLGIVRGETELALLRRGYVRERTATPSGMPVALREGDTLRALAERGVIRREAWEAIQKGLRDEEGGVVGPLSTDAPLPGGTFLYMDEQGFPIAIGRTPNERPSVPLLRRTGPARPEATKLDLLERRLTPGQIIFTNVSYGQRAAGSRGYATLGRMFQSGAPTDEAFFAVHPMVVEGRDAQGRIILTDLMPSGTRRVLLRDVAGPGRRIGSVAVCSLPDPAAAERFVQALGRLQGSFRYSFRRARQLGASRLRNLTDGGDDVASREVMESEGVCVDFIRRAAQDAGIPELAGASSALEMFNRLPVEYALEL